jgi:hypothetical protein
VEAPDQNWQFPQDLLCMRTIGAPQFSFLAVYLLKPFTMRRGAAGSWLHLVCLTVMASLVFGRTAANGRKMNRNSGVENSMGFASVSKDRGAHFGR